MALTLAESLIEQGAFDPMDQGYRYWKLNQVQDTNLTCVLLTLHTNRC